MQRIYASFDTIFLGHLHNLMATEGIRSEIRNQYIAGGFGELPATEAMPELWVEDFKLAYANEILQQALKQQANAPVEPWVCPICHTTIDGQYSQCWNCLYLLKSSS
jgi:hypothetical protein